MMAKKNDTDKLSELLSSFNGDLLKEDVPQYFNDDSIRVERICWIWFDLIRFSHAACWRRKFTLHFMRIDTLHRRHYANVASANIKIFLSSLMKQLNEQIGIRLMKVYCGMSPSYRIKIK